MKTLVFSATLFVVCLLIPAGQLAAQVIQLPTLRVFNVNTTVSVTDGGGIRLGGVNRSANGSIRRGAPGLRGPLFNNRARGQSLGANQATVKVRLIDLSELEAEVLNEARRRREKNAANDPNGLAAIQNRADFITRNIGRSKKR